MKLGCLICMETRSGLQKGQIFNWFIRWGCSGLWTTEVVLSWLLSSCSDAPDAWAQFWYLPRIQPGRKPPVSAPKLWPTSVPVRQTLPSYLLNISSISTACLTNYRWKLGIVRDGEGKNQTHLTRASPNSSQLGYSSRWFHCHLESELWDHRKPVLCLFPLERFSSS